MLSRNLNICGGYDPFFAHYLILGRNSNICGRYDLFFCWSCVFGAPLTKGPKRIFCPGARKFSRRPCVWPLLRGITRAGRSREALARVTRLVWSRYATYRYLRCVVNVMLKSLSNYRTCLQSLVNLYSLPVIQKQRTPHWKTICLAREAWSSVFTVWKCV